MSAIAAVAFRSGRADPAIVNRMLQAAPHRGELIEVHLNGACALGISKVDAFPESSLAAGGGFVAACTGTLDNLPEIVDQLRRRDVPQVLGSPAAVLITAFRTMGTDLLERLRGVFAVIFTDGVRLWCFRDQLGLRTLFYRDEPRGCFVATEAKQIVAGAGIPRDPDADVVEQIFYGSYDDETPTALKGVRRLPKATILTVDRAGVTLKRYWHPEMLLETARVTGEELQHQFERVMRQAVARAITGNDVISLSGGIDSPTIAAFAAQEHLERTGRPIAALAAVYPNLPSVDETPYIRDVARSLKIPLHTYKKAARPLDRLEEWVRLLDGPVPKILVTDAEEHFRVARRLGYGTMLTGEVAEFVADMRSGLSAHLLMRGKPRELWAYMRAQRARGAALAGIGWQVLSGFVPGGVEAAIIRLRGHRGRPDVPHWVDAKKVNEAAARYLVPARHRWRQQQFAGLDGPGLTVEANEIVQALCGVRVRMPWADVDVWEFFLSLPAEVKFPNAIRKGLVRRLMRGKVPAVILDRMDKTVFRDSMLARADYAEFGRWLIKPACRIAGVNYDALAHRIRDEDFTIRDFIWAKDLAAAHAFLGSG